MVHAPRTEPSHGQPRLRGAKLHPLLPGGAVGRPVAEGVEGDGGVVVGGWGPAVLSCRAVDDACDGRSRSRWDTCRIIRTLLQDSRTGQADQAVA